MQAAHRRQLELTRILKATSNHILQQREETVRFSFLQVERDHAAVPYGPGDDHRVEDRSAAAHETSLPGCVS
jgi:hypothetical protein